MAHSKDDPDQHGSSSNVETRRDLSSKDHAPSKVIIRRLPPTLTPENFLEHVSPLPDYDFFYFVRADMSLGQNAFTRAYISFLSPEDIFTFRDRFDGYVFIDAKGGEYPAIVEFAPFQKVPKKKTKKLDTKIGLIEQDSDYKKFLETLSKPTESVPVSLDAMVAEVETKESTLAKLGSSKVTTPLLDYLRRRREERKLNIAKLKDERRRGGGRNGDMDRKRSGKDELDKHKLDRSSKDALRDRDRDRRRDRVRIRERDRRRERVGLRSEKPKDAKPVEKRWQKEIEVAPRHTVMLLRNTDRDSHGSEKSLSGKPPVGEWERKEREVAHENYSDNEQGRGGGNEPKREDRRGKREGRWGEGFSREDERNHYGGKERVRGGEDDRYKDKMSRGGSGRGYRDERGRYLDERGGEKYSSKDKGVSVRTMGSRNSGGGPSMRDKYDGGGSDKKGGSGDAWRRREADVDRKRIDKEKGSDNQYDTGRGRGKDNEKKDREERLTSMNEENRDDKDRQKEEENCGRRFEQRENTYREEANLRLHSDSVNPPMSRPESREEEERAGSVETDDKKRKRKDRPERQIYIPRKALERQKQGSPQMGKSSDDDPRT